MAPEAIRRKGALGDLPVSPHEKIEILSALASDKHEGIRTQALKTLQQCPVNDLLQTLDEPALAPEVFDFLVNHLLSDRQDTEVTDWNASLADTQELAGRTGDASSNPTGTAAMAPLSPPPEIAGSAQPQAGPTEPAADDEDEKKETLLQKFSGMTPVQKIGRAFLGTKEERFILIRDGNKAVARSVLQSPKISDSEIEVYASMKNVTEEVLRHIYLNRRFMKNYSVVRTLAANPRSPLDVSLPLVKRLNDRDLKLLSIDKNVSDAVRTAAVKLAIARQQGKG